MDRHFPIRLRTFLVPLFGAALYFAVQLIVATGFVLIYHSTDVNPYIGSISVAVGIIMIPCLFLWLYFSKGLEKKEMFRQKISVTTGVSGTVIALGMLGVAGIYFYLLVRLSDSIPAIKDSLSEYMDMVSDEDITLVREKVLFGVAVSLIYPVIEEVLFRGIIMQEFLCTMGKVPAIILSGLIFGLMHGQPIQIGYAFICGMILSSVYYFSQSIYVSILTHAVFNFFGTVAVDLLADSEEAVIALEYIEYTFIFFAVAAMMYLVYRWKNAQNREETKCGTS